MPSTSTMKLLASTRNEDEKNCLKFGDFLPFAFSVGNSVPPVLSYVLSSMIK